MDVEERRTYSEQAAHNEHLKFVRHAWFSVRKSTVKHGFEKVVNSGVITKDSFVGPRRHLLKRDRIKLIGNDLSQEFRKALPDIPNIVIQYYLTQEAEIGLSIFLRTKVQEMQYRL
ncbi:hypothetical protein BGX34_007042 [Mortierella sp. NVP85]|nr:hypothetical protein BGX34_007042 [Mortierella sp. NVP85]